MSISDSFCSSIECPKCSFEKYNINYPCPNCGFKYQLQEKWKIYKKGDKIQNRYQVYDTKEGGMGVVYLCYDNEWKAPVAIKTILPEYFKDEKRRYLFKNEAENWIRLEKNINIVTARYIEDVDYFPHIFMELITNNEFYGADLKSWLDKNYQFTAEEILNYSIQFCDGMIYAKQKYAEIGKVFVHRDIKPSNILITESKIIKITDFGLTGGTIGYKSPEQINNEILDERSDIYSFGLVMNEMLYSIKNKHTSSLLEEKLEGIIKKCLKQKKEDRWKNFNELRTILDNLYYELTGNVNQRFDDEKLNIDELLNKGTSLGVLDKHEEALECFDKILKIRPISFQASSWNRTLANPQVWYNRGYALKNLGNLNEALKCFDMALHLNNHESRIWNSKGDVLYALGNLKEASECYEHALKFNPQDPLSLVKKGRLLGKTGKCEEAIFFFDEALKINPEYLEAWLNKGVILEGWDNHEKAIACYDKAIKFSFNYWTPYFNKAISEYNLGKQNEANEDFQKAIEYIEQDLQNTPNDEEKWHCKGIALYRTNKISDAITCFEKVLKINPNHAEAKTVLQSIENVSEIYDYLKEGLDAGMYLYGQGRYEEAMQYFNKILEVMPECEDDLFISIYLSPLFQQVFGDKAATLAQLGRYNEAIEHFNKLLEMNNNSPEGWFGKGSSLLMLNHYEESIECYNKALENNKSEDTSKRADIWYYMGVAFKKLGDEKEASKCFNNAEKLSNY